MELGLVIHKSNLSPKIKASGVDVYIVDEGEESTTLLLSCGIIEESEMEAAIKKLYIGSPFNDSTLLYFLNKGMGITIEACELEIDPLGPLNEERNPKGSRGNAKGSRGNAKVTR